MTKVVVVYRFDDCVLDSDRRDLRRGGASVLLQPQVFDLLELLIRNRDRVVGKEEVLDAVWHGRVISEAALHTRLSEARNAIGDNGTEQRLIRTLRTKGYRFIGAVHEEAQSSAATRVGEVSRNRTSLADRPTIAVVPFTCTGGDPARESALADGASENLNTALSKVGWLCVAPRASSFAFKNQAIGAADTACRLGVRYLLHGNVRLAGERRRISVQLVDAIANHQIWAECYDWDSIDSFIVQDQICKQVAAAVEPQLYVAELLRANRKPAASLTVWECIIRALSLMTNRDQKSVAAAHALLQKAVTIDPHSAQAHSLLSMTTTLRVHMSWGDRRNVIPTALACARKALSLNPAKPSMRCRR